MSQYVIDTANIKTPSEAAAVSEIMAGAVGRAVSIGSPPLAWRKAAISLGVEHLFVPATGDTSNRLVFMEFP